MEDQLEKICFCFAYLRKHSRDDSLWLYQSDHTHPGK